MRRVQITFLAFLGIMGFSVSQSVAGQSAGTIVVEPGFQLPDRTFSQCCPRPSWWDDVQAPTIHTVSDFGEVWRSKTLAKSQKAKAMFRSIEDLAESNPEVASKAIAYYRWVDRGYPHLTQLLEFGTARYFNHDRLLVGYSGRPGDTTAGLVRSLARQYLRANRPRDAAALIARLVGERGHEINDQMLELASLQMIDALIALERNEDALDVAEHAISAYEGDWEKKLYAKRDKLRDVTGVSSFDLQEGPAMYALLAALLGLIVLVVVVRFRPTPA